MKAQAQEAESKAAALPLPPPPPLSAFKMLGPLSGDKYEVPATGAYLDMQEAKSRLMLFCAKLPRDKCVLLGLPGSSLTVDLLHHFLLGCSALTRGCMNCTAVAHVAVRHLWTSLHSSHVHLCCLACTSG